MSRLIIKPYYDHIVGRTIEVEGGIVQALIEYQKYIRVLQGDEWKKAVKDINEYGSAIVGDYQIIYYED